MTDIKLLFEKQLGKPSREASFGRGDESFGVSKWVMGPEPGGTTMYAAYREGGGGAVSVVLVTSRAVDSVASELAWTQREIEIADNIKAGDTLNLQKALWIDGNMNIFSVNAPLSSVSDHVDVSVMHDSGVHIFQVIPLFNSELVLQKRLGVKQFHERLLDGGSYLNPDRNPLT